MALHIFELKPPQSEIRLWGLLWTRIKYTTSGDIDGTDGDTKARKRELEWQLNPIFVGGDGETKVASFCPGGHVF